MLVGSKLVRRFLKRCLKRFDRCEFLIYDLSEGYTFIANYL